MKRKGQISRQVSLLVVIFIMVIVAITYALTAVSINNLVVGENKQILETKASENAQIISDWLGEQKTIIQTMSESLNYMNTSDHEKLMNYLEVQLPNNDAALMYYVGLGKEGISLPADHSKLDINPNERSWYTDSVAANDIIITDPYVDAATGNMVISIAAPFWAKDQQAVLLADITLETLTQIVDKVNKDKDTQAFLLTSDDIVITHSNSEYLPNTEKNTVLTDVVSVDTQAQEIVNFIDYDGSTKFLKIVTVPETGWKLGVSMDTNVIQNIFLDSVKSNLIIIIVLILVAGLLILLLLSRLLAPVSNMCEAIIRISQGDFSVEVETTKRKDEIGILQNTVAELKNTLTTIIGETNEILAEMASYNLDLQDMKEYPGMFNDLAISVNSIRHILGSLLCEMQTAVAGVDNGSNQLAQAADMLSQGTTTQAQSIQKLQEDVGEVAQRIKRNSDNCDTVNGKLVELDAKIQEGDQQMNELLHAVEEIAEMSVDIQKIVGAIDNIAFQTNLLSLNASVEAARAGENGKGFAVVATEVRNLAYKSSEESKKTSELIEACIASINRAKSHAQSTSGCLETIVSNSAEIAQAFDSISTDTTEQANRSDRIKEEIENISDVVQSNTAAAQQTAASSEELSSQATSLNDIVKQFRI